LRNSNQSIVVCATDNIALGCLKAAYKLGIAVPDTLSVTGFGGYDVTEAIHPGITTAKFHYKEAGKKAAV
ncbi:substrate-binding domain-containing protein, partial [Mesorhizobium sp. M7A.F.Ca.MR.362.00.0.0]